MKKFYLELWLHWVVRVILCSVTSAGVIAALITFVLYFNKGMPSLSDDVMQALENIYLFWFMIVLNLTVLFALFRSAKYLFNRCYGGYQFAMLSCPKETTYLEVVGYGDIVKFWRKWLMLLVWIVASFVLLSWIGSLLFIEYGKFFSYFTVWWLYGYILLAGFFSFMLIGSRCKQVKVRRC